MKKKLLLLVVFIACLVLVSKAQNDFDQRDLSGKKRYSPLNPDMISSNLNAATPNSFSVQAPNLANNFPYSANSVNGTAATLEDITPPSIPTNLHVEIANDISITLGWNNSTDDVGVTGYDIFVNGTKQYSSTTRYMVVTNLTPSTRYSFTVQAHDEANNYSGFTNPVIGTTSPAPAATSPTTPTNLHVVSVSLTSITLDWDNSTDDGGVVGYRVHVNGNNLYSTPTSEFVVNLLDPGTTYSFVVQAYDAAPYFSLNSNVVYATTSSLISDDKIPPSAPTNLHTVYALNSIRTVTLFWDNSTDNVGVAGYDVYLGLVKKYTTVKPEVVVENLVPGSNNSFRVRAHDEAYNLSAYSNLITVTTPFVDKPANLHVVSVTSSSVALDWDDADGVGPIGYDIFVNNVKRFSSNRSDFVVGNLSPNTTYTFRVQAYNLVPNYSENSNVVTATTSAAVDYAPPGAPSNLHIVSTTGTSITLDWDNSIDNVGVAGYDVFINGSKAFPTTSSDYVVSNLVPNTTYTFMIQAHDAANNYSEFSNVVSGTTAGVTPPVDTIPPTGPSNLHVVSATNNSITLDWDNSIDIIGVAGYDVFINDVKTFATVNSDFVVFNLSSNTTYTFKVQAHDVANNYSEFSNLVNGTTTGVSSPDYAPPTGPGNLHVVAVTGSSITLDWDNSIDNVAVAGYDVFVNDVKTFATVNSDFVVVNLSANTSYTFKVQAHDVANNYSEFSNLVSGVTSGSIVQEGLNYKYYEGTWSMLPDFNALTPFKTGTSSTTDIRVRTPGVNDNFGFLWEGYINIPTPGVYTFETISDDGSKIYFNSIYSFGGAAVVNSDGLHPAFPVNGTVNIPSAGQYPIAITFFEQSGGETMEVYWTGPGIERQLIPGSAFRLNNSAVDDRVVASTGNGKEQSADRLNTEMGIIKMQSVYPNPFTNSFIINFHNATAANKISVDLVDVSGRLLFKQNFGNLSAGATTLKINVGNKLLPGVYFARLNINGRTMKMMKLVKK